MNYSEEIERLKKEKNAVVLAHYYQTGDIQDIADFVGDSLQLSQQAAETNADMIVFAGVHFMAETAKILSPDKKVVIPDLEAGCSLADSCPPNAFSEFKKQHKDHVVISYINCTAEIKAQSDYICTSSNAKSVVNAVPKDKPIIFAPDKNLGRYLIQETGREMVLWDGSCLVHESFSIDKILDLYQKYPDAHIIAHPEAQEHILKVAEFVGSTTALLSYVKESEAKTFIIATESGILHKMQSDNPNKTLIAAPMREDSICACNECPYMKMNTMEKLYLCIKNESPEIKVNEELRIRALTPINRMLEIS
jgi:quinolinate synthase